MATRTIAVDYLARVEGEGALTLVIRDGVVEEAALKIFEPPRYFEKLMVDRAATEAPDIAARICGICPVAYQLSAVTAIEDAWGVPVSPPVEALRRLLLCGEWISSHGLHVALLHAPDFLGYADAVEMAKDHGEAVRRGLAVKKVGNAIMDVVGGREIHPINVRVGGFYRVPSSEALDGLARQVEAALPLARAALDWVAGFDVPDIAPVHERVALVTDGAYPLAPGRIVSTGGIDIAPARYEETFEEVHEPRSTALHSRIVGRGAYLTGPSARFALSHRHLNPEAGGWARAFGIAPLIDNPYRSIVLRSLEILHALEEAAELLASRTVPDRPFEEGEPRAATGFGVIEAPRGLLYQRYETDGEGRVREVRIVPPTSQNQASIEADVKAVAEAFVDADDEALQMKCEQAIRNHDPCISCATHFLKMTTIRS